MKDATCERLCKEKLYYRKDSIKVMLCDHLLSPMRCLISSSRQPGTVSTWQGSRPWDWYSHVGGGPLSHTPSDQSNTCPACTDRTPSRNPKNTQCVELYKNCFHINKTRNISQAD